MAKITTKKPTVLIQTGRSKEKPSDTAPETTPVAPTPPAERPVAAAPKSPIAGPVASNKPPLETAPLYNPPKRKGPPALLILLALVLVVGAASKFLTPKRELSEVYSSASGDLSKRMLLEDERSKLSGSIWKNEEPGLIARIFHRLCLGYATSDGCGEKPLHPFTKVYDEVGKPLKFASEPDRVVIEQTIEYNSRGFALGKEK